MSKQKIIVAGANFLSDLKQWEREDYSHDVVFNLGATPMSLTSCGLPLLSLAITGKVLEKNYFHHGITLEKFSTTMALLTSPLAIYKSATVEKNSIVVQTDQLLKGESIIVAIKFDAYIERLNVNRISSMYTKPQGVIDGWERNGLRIH